MHLERRKSLCLVLVDLEEDMAVGQVAMAAPVVMVLAVMDPAEDTDQVVAEASSASAISAPTVTAPPVAVTPVSTAPSPA